MFSFQPASGVFGVIGEDEVGAGAMDAGENFQHDALLVDPAFLRGGFDHRVFAADIVGANGHVEFVAHLANDVEIRQRGLDHHDVGALFQIERDFPQRFARVGGVHLIAAAIAELRRGLRGFAKRTVKGGAVFRGVGE